MEETAKQLAERLYKELVGDRLEPLIVKYNPITGVFKYHPYRHAFEKSTEESLAGVLFDHLVFYSFEDAEIKKEYEGGRLENVRTAAKEAYRDLVPKTEKKLDGMLGELLLDAMLRKFYPQTKTVISRVKYLERQPKREIKRELYGYDAIMFSEGEGQISIWLGQAKTGDWDYCSESIRDDLNKNILKSYFAAHMIILATYKRGDNLGGLTKVINDINQIKYDTVEEGNDKRYDAIISYFVDNKIQILMPSLLLYQANEYENTDDILADIKNKCETDLKNISVTNAEPLNINALFIIFPVRNLDMLRGLLLESRLAVVGEHGKP